jgi:Cof subfamily protein (haloacid dehalogenase superfamily)
LSYRLFAFDLDGTLLGPDYQIHASVPAALSRLTERGAVVAIATGRTPSSARPFAQSLGVETPLITCNGAWIRCLKSGTDLMHQTIPDDLAHEVLDALTELGLHVNVYHDDQLWMRSLTPFGELYLKHSNVPAKFGEVWPAFTVAGPTKIVALGAEPRIVEAKAQLQAQFGRRLWMNQSLPVFLEITHPEANKGAALALLATQLGVPREAVVAVGDGLNDAEMIEWAGLGVAMGNADPALCALADRVTPAVEAGGIATLVDNLILEGAV